MVKSINHATHSKPTEIRNNRHVCRDDTSLLRPRHHRTSSATMEEDPVVTAGSGGDGDDDDDGDGDGDGDDDDDDDGDDDESEVGACCSRGVSAIATTLSSSAKVRRATEVASSLIDACNY